MNRNKKITQTMALAMTGIMIANAGMGSVYAADQKAAVEKETESTTEAVTEKETETETEKKESTKEETVYVQASPSGETQEIIVSDWLKNVDGESSLTDKSDLTDIKNVKGDETFSQDGDKITWDANGNDIYYQGTSTKDLPVSLKVTYYLDGQEISPEDLAGKSGHVKMVYQYTNNMKQGDIYTPFVLFTGMILPGDNFSNVKVDNGKAISDGDKNIVIGVGLPGLEDSLKLKKNKTDILDDLDIDLDIPDSFEVEADVTDFNLSMSMTVATPLSLDDLELDDIDDEDDLKDKIDEIADAATQLVDGTSDLADGVQELKDGCSDLIDGIGQLDDGAGSLNDGIQTLNNKKGDLINGIKQLSDGLNQLDAKKGELVDGVNQLAGGAAALDTGAASAKAGMTELAGGISYLNANRTTLVGGLSKLIEGVNGKGGLESYKEALTTNGARYLAENLHAFINATKPKFDGFIRQMEAVKGIVETNAEEPGEMDKFIAGLSQYVTTANKLLDECLKAASNPSGGATTQSADTGAAVQYSFADSNPQAIASLEASIQGNENVLASLKDVQSKTKSGSIPEKLLKEYSGAYNTYSGQLNNCIAQLESDIANQKAALEAMKLVQTVAGTQEIAQQSAEEGNSTAVNAGTLAENVAAFKESGENVITSAKTLQYTLTKYLDALIQGAEELEAAFYTDGETETTTGEEESQTNVLNKLSTGADALSAGISRLYEEGIDVMSEELGKLSPSLLSELNTGIQDMNTGAIALQSGLNSLKDGTGQLADGTKSLQSGAGALADGVGQLAAGGKQLKAGGTTLASGVQQLADGSSKLKDGTSQLKDGSGDLDSGVDELLDGANELRDGMEEFDEEAIQKIVDFADEDLQDMIDRLKDIRDAGDAYQLFTDGEKGTNGSVKFIIETASIGDED